MKKLVTTLAAILPLIAGPEWPKAIWNWDNSTAVILVIIIAGLMMIAMLGSVVIGAAEIVYEKFKLKPKQRNEGANCFCWCFVAGE